MRIALFTTSFPSERDASLNAGVCVKDFAALLTRAGHDVVVLTPNKRGARHDFEHRATVFFPWLGNSDSLTHIRMWNPWGLVQLGSVVVMGTLAAVRLCRQERPDHVLCFWAFPPGLWALVARGVTGTPYSVWALGSDIWKLGKLPLIRQALRRIARRATARYADGVALARDFEAIAGEKVSFLATSRVLEAPAAAAIPGSGGYFLFLGRFHPHKGIDLLFEALKQVRTALPSGFKLRVHGFGPLQAELERRLREDQLSDLIELGGPTSAEDTPNIIRRARGLIVPSRQESIPLVLSDALQAEVPVLVTDVGDMGTLVRDFDAGLVCAPTAEGIAEGVLRLVQEERPRPGAQRLRDHLDIRHSVSRFVAEVAKSPPLLEEARGNHADRAERIP